MGADRQEDRVSGQVQEHLPDAAQLGELGEDHADHALDSLVGVEIQLARWEADVAHRRVAEQLSLFLKTTRLKKRQSRVALHVSGALSSLVLRPLTSVGFAIGSMHPLISVSDPNSRSRISLVMRVQSIRPDGLFSLHTLSTNGADVNKPFVGALHSTTLCCGASINSTPFYRAATAADMEVLKLMLDHGAKIEWSPSEVKPKDGKPAGRPNPNLGKTPLMASIKGGQGAPIAGGPGFTRIGPPSFREPVAPSHLRWPCRRSASKWRCLKSI